MHKKFSGFNWKCCHVNGPLVCGNTFFGTCVLCNVRWYWINNCTSCRRLSSSASVSKSGLFFTPGSSCHSVGEEAEMGRRGEGGLPMDCWGTLRLLKELVWDRVWGCRRTWGRGGRGLCDSLGEWFGEEDERMERLSPLIEIESEWDSKSSLFWTTSLYSWYNWESAKERDGERDHLYGVRTVALT